MPYTKFVETGPAQFAVHATPQANVVVPSNELHPALRSHCEATPFAVHESQYLHQLCSYANVGLFGTLSARTIELNALHALNHAFMAGHVALAHRGKAERAPTQVAPHRDKNIGKTRVLVLLPMRNIALKYVHLMIKILGLGTHSGDPARKPKLDSNLERLIIVGDQVENYDGFYSDFSEVEDLEDPTFHRRPNHYKQTFEGNIDDNFCFGIRLPNYPPGSGTKRKNKFVIYSHVLNSDILIASPLGLRRRIAKNVNVLVSLASIEVLIIDKAHILYMQNYDHLNELLDKFINHLPSHTEGNEQYQ